MAYRDYMTDTVTLNVITQTVNNKNAVVPGVTVREELAGLVQAGTAEFYYNLAPSVGETDAGSDFDTDQSGSKKAILPLSRALHIDEKVPNVAVETTEADVLMDRMVKGSIAISNKLGSKFVSALKDHGQAQTYTNGLNLYEAIVEAQETFATGTSERIGDSSDTSFDHKENGIEARTIMVGPSGRGKLQSTDAFQRVINATGEFAGMNVLGEILGMVVVYSQDLTGADFILLDPEGVAFPYAINTLRAVDSEQFNGVRVQGEIAYSADTTDIVPIDSMVMVFTEASA